MAPRVYFAFQSSEIRAGANQISTYAMLFIRKSAPHCRYKLVARADSLEASEDPTLSIARRRAEDVVHAFEALGVARDRFEIVVKIGEMSRHPQYGDVLRDFDRIVSIHSAHQDGKVTCLEPMTSCPACVLKFSSGGECHLIPGGEY